MLFFKFFIKKLLVSNNVIKGGLVILENNLVYWLFSKIIRNDYF